MAQDESPPPSGLLSKVVKFVRNPTMNWSDLDQPELDKESVYSKQMLKEMIERKRRNDFVRRREFDQLRKLRQREALTGASPGADDLGRPSFFQSSLPSKSEDRAGTLKKIDEIEAQMSMQWWKSKDVGASTPVPLSSRAGLVKEMPDVLKLSDEPASSDSTIARHYAATVPASLPGHLRDDASHLHDFRHAGDAGYAATEVSPLFGAPGGGAGGGAGRASAPAHEPMVDMLAALNDSLELDYDAAPPEALDVPDFVHAPELEEAAIRFANGDDAGAESAILAVLEGEPEQLGPSETWLTLFDLYRATNQQDRFDTVGIDFATRFNRSAPAWFSMPALAGHPQPPAADAGHRPGAPGTPGAVVRGHGFNWSSPGVMGASAVVGLQSMVQSKAPQSLRLSWANLLSIDVAALDGLSLLLAGWGEQDVQLCFADGERLEAVVKAATRSGDRSVNQAWWRLRLELLRVMQRPDEFDLVALEYCITYEVSPPSWRPVRCSFAVVQADDYDGLPPREDAAAAEPEPSGNSEFKSTDFGSSSLPGPAQATTAVGMGTLSGLVLGDATQALASLEGKVKEGGLLVISCDHLIRIDFSAAGSVLNWAAAQQGAGRRVEFRGLHRLVAIFFNVIGINENARVMPRRN